MSPAIKTAAGKSSRQEWTATDGGVTAAREFVAAGIAAGIKKTGLDVAVVYSKIPSVAAAVFTTNRVQAAPILLTKEHLKRSRGLIRSVLLNSGCANACTGPLGLRHAKSSAARLATLLKIPTEQVAVASTGVIGSFLPVRKLLAGIPLAVSSLGECGGGLAMQAIMTTDTREKTAALEGQIRRLPVRIGGMAKGAGMIHPQMATMLSVLTTDVGISKRDLKCVLRRVIERTFNCLTVDGDTSTNDMVIILANGASGARVDRKTLPVFEDGLRRVCESLARSVARDGEGATKFVEIWVEGASRFEHARRMAKAIAHSPLVKTALCGEELNWGRILCAAGYSQVPFDPDRAELRVSGIPIFRNGRPLLSTRAKAEAALRKQDIQIHLKLRCGMESARVWTCDLSHGYVDINASYIS